MPHDSLLAFALFAFVSSITPGPNNLMLLASGANFGLRASVPHVLGITSGFMVLVASVGFGLAAVFSRAPWAYSAMRWLGAAYLLFLAWRIARAAPPEISQRRAGPARPMRYWGAVAFQWVNPKAWLMALSAFSTYVPAGGGAPAVLGAVALYGAINLPSVTAWAIGGSQLQRFVRTRRRALAFNLAMAGLLVASLLPMLHALPQPARAGVAKAAAARVAGRGHVSWRPCTRAHPPQLQPS